MKVFFICLVNLVLAFIAKSEDLHIKPATINNGSNRYGCGSVITDSSGRYFVTARHIVEDGGKFAVFYDDKGQKKKEYLVAVLGNVSSDLVVGLLGDQPTIISLNKEGFGERCGIAIHIGFTHLRLHSQTRVCISNGQKVMSVGVWDEFEPEHIECLNTVLPKGSSGMGFVDERCKMFWVLSAEWPKLAMKRLQDDLNSKGFMLICGETIEDIQAMRQKLLIRSRQKFFTEPVAKS